MDCDSLIRGGSEREGLQLSSAQLSSAHSALLGMDGVKGGEGAQGGDGREREREQGGKDC